MDDEFDWDWLVLMGFTQYEGAPDGVLILRSQKTGDSLVCNPEFNDHELGEASWLYRRDKRNNYIPQFLVPKTKEDLFWLLKKLGFEK